MSRIHATNRPLSYKYINISTVHCTSIIADWEKVQWGYILLLHFQIQLTITLNNPHLWSTRLMCVSRDLPFSKGSTRYLEANTIEGTPLLGGARGWLIDVDTSAQTPRSRSVHDLGNKKKKIYKLNRIQHDSKWFNCYLLIGIVFTYSCGFKIVLLYAWKLLFLWLSWFEVTLEFYIANWK